MFFLLQSLNERPEVEVPQSHAGVLVDPALK